jgi:site-specific recombinase XerD
MAPEMQKETVSQPGNHAPFRPGATRARKPVAPETVRLYASDWMSFLTWCRAAGLPSLPACPATVASFLRSCNPALSAGALARRAAAIGDQHRRLGHASPAADPTVKAILREARSTATRRRPLPPPPTQLTRLAIACAGDLAGLRDRALLLLLATGLGRTALMGLDSEQIRFSTDSVALTVQGREGDDQPVVIARGQTADPCPVRALEDWIRVSDTRFGPVFRKIDRWGNLEYRRLGTDAVRRILARRGARRMRRGIQAQAA